MAETYNLVFLPRLRDDVDGDEVRRKLSQTLSVDLDKVDSWYAADSPTVILKDVTDDVAERYMRAIIKCGAQCEVQAAQADGEGGLSLVPKRFRTTDVFTCPSCQHQEEIPLGDKLETCPSCGLVMAKWEERKAQEEEKDKIRRRLMRQQRLAEDRESDLERKREELERLQRLEAEIMAELGIKPPSALMQAFQRHPVSITFAGLVVVIGATVIGMQQINNYLMQQQAAAVAAAPASAEVQAMAPTVSSAIQLQQTGAQQAMAELAKVTGMMQPEGNLTPQQAAKLTAAATMMMKGGDPGGFVDLAGPGTDNPSYETVGAVSDLPGVEEFPSDTMDSFGGAAGEHGHEGVFKVLGEKRFSPDPANPDGPPRVTDAVEKLDGSQMVDLMKDLEKDREWDLFLLRTQQRLIPGW